MQTCLKHRNQKIQRDKKRNKNKDKILKYSKKIQAVKYVIVKKLNY